ncbi:MAG: A/G-specific adenine glycosylase [Bacillota bacterium]
MPADALQGQTLDIAADLLRWYRAHRRDLPWRRERDPYRIWISEVMLQQTQVATAIPYYEQFVAKFPTLDDLAVAETDEVLRAWEGLGYYSRARNLHAAVREVKASFGGQVPSEIGLLRSLKGVGEYTAGAIASIAYNKPEPAVDGNVLRVISRLFAINEDVGLPATRRRITGIVKQIMPSGEASDFTQALMELGALVCVPNGGGCAACPLQLHCQALSQGMVGELPTNNKRTKVSNHTMVVVLWEHNQRYAVEQRPAQGLLAGQWQLPMIEAPTDSGCIGLLLDFINRNTMPDGREYHAMGLYPYQFTHRRWEQYLYGLAAVPALDQSYTWATRSELEQLHLITAHKRLVRKFC